MWGRAEAHEMVCGHPFVYTEASDYLAGRWGKGRRGEGSREHGMCWAAGMEDGFVPFYPVHHLIPLQIHFLPSLSIPPPRGNHSDVYYRSASSMISANDTESQSFCCFYFHRDLFLRSSHAAVWIQTHFPSSFQ